MVDIIVEEWAPNIWTHSRSHDTVWEGEGAKQKAYADAIRVAGNNYRVVFGLTLEQKAREKRLGINTTPKPNRLTKKENYYYG